LRSAQLASAALHAVPSTVDSARDQSLSTTTAEIIDAVHARRAPMVRVSATLRL
jgi:hypothetical protein